MLYKLCLGTPVVEEKDNKCTTLPTEKTSAKLRRKLSAMSTSASSGFAKPSVQSVAGVGFTTSLRPATYSLTPSQVRL